MTDHDDLSTKPTVTKNRTSPFLVMIGVLVTAATLVGVLLLVTSDDDTPDDDAAVTQPATTPPATTPPATTQPESTEPTDTEAPPTSTDRVELTISRGGTATEEPADFYAGLAESLSSGDLEFAMSRLDPAMDDLYGFDRCRATLTSLVDPTFDIDFYRVKRTEPWLFESPAGTVDIDETTVTAIALLGSNQSGTRDESHLTIFDGRYHWFTYC